MKPFIRTTLAAAVLATATFAAWADVVADWNTRAGEIVIESKLGTPPAVRVMALVQTAVLQAVDAATQRRADVDAAVAAANRATLSKLLPAQQASIDAAYQAALAKIADGPGKERGVSIGEQAAIAVLAMRKDDVIVPEVGYRPFAAAGTYVPTAMPAAAQWSQRKPWVMTSVAQFRPAPPPALKSDVWARDYNEIRTIGSKGSTQRTAEQTEIARFWEYSMPPIYFGVVRSVANAAGREPMRNAQLYAAAAQAMDDAMIAVFEAKYAYNFWRPVTAIRNGDIDGNDATAAEATWTPLIDNPMHPEYPSAHSILAAAVGTVLKTDVNGGTMPTLATSSPTAKGATRRWADVDEFVREVMNARVYEGIHYRFSTEVGAAMGQQIGALVATKVLQSPQ